jgi:uncharacterized delta-60 repeat protein
MRLFILAALFVAIIQALASCTPPEPVPTIGPGGGTAEAVDGALVVVPAGALTSQVPIAITLTSGGAPDLPADYEGSGAVYTLTPHGTTFLKPVTVSLPVDPVLAASGRAPRLLKTNSLGDWYELTGAAATTSSAGDVITGQTSSFSHITTVTAKRDMNGDGLARSWYFWAVPYDGSDTTLAVPPPSQQVQGEVHVRHEFGPLPAEFYDDIADAEVFSTADGKTYWVYAEGPGDDEPELLGGNVVRYNQGQSFRKERGDASLRFTITAVSLEGKHFGGLDLIPYQCVGSDVCDLEFFGTVSFSATAWTSGSTRRTLLSRSSQLSLSSHAVQVTPGQPVWEARALSTNGTPLWDLDTDFVQELESRDGFVRLARPITVEVDLSEVAVGDLVILDVEVKVETFNQIQGETYIAGFFRDPLSIEGGDLEYTGLTPVAEYEPPPDDAEAEQCATSIDPAAGTIQFSASSYDLMELPVGLERVIVTREGGSSGDVSVRIDSDGGTALEGEDYLGVSQVVRFADGDAGSRAIELPLVVDAAPEAVERLTLRLSEPRGCVGLGTPSVATINVYDNDTPVDPNLGLYGVSGTVTGLEGSGLVLTGFGDFDVTIDQDGPFAFPQRWPTGVRYDVRVRQQPTGPAQACSVANGSGTLQHADVTNVLVTCTPPDDANPFLDATFGVAGMVTGPLGLGDDVVDVLVQSDGKVLVLDHTKLSRFTANGAPDPTFGTGGSVAVAFLGTTYDIAHAMALQPDGKIVVAGETRVSVNDANGHDWAVARFTTLGVFDGSFGGSGTGSIVGDLGSTTGSPFHESLADVVIQPDGKIVVGGSVNRFNQGSDFLVMRLTSAGVLDGGFAAAGVAASTDIGGNYDSGRSLALQADGRIVLAGRVAPSGGSDPDIGMLRFEVDGDLDTSFGVQGVLRDQTTEWDEPFDLLVLDDGGIMVAGPLNRLPANGGPIGMLTLYTPDGERDDGFGGDGRVLVEGLETIRALAAQTDGSYVLVGSAVPINPGDYDFLVLRLDAAGTRDATFGDAGIVAVDFYAGIDSATAITVQPDGKLLVAGTIKNGTTGEMGLIRVMP